MWKPWALSACISLPIPPLSLSREESRRSRNLIVWVRGQESSLFVNNANRRSCQLSTWKSRIGGHASSLVFAWVAAHALSLYGTREKSKVTRALCLEITREITWVVGRTSSLFENHVSHRSCELSVIDNTRFVGQASSLVIISVVGRRSDD